MAFFDNSPNMLNVAVSRAKRSFLVFGDMDIFDPSLNHPSSILAKYLFALEDNEITDICPPTLSHAIVEDLEPITTLFEHRQNLIQSFSKTQQILNIISPYLSKKAIRHDNIENLIKNHSTRIIINIYADASLHEEQRYFEEASNILKKAGANVISVEKVHSKIIAIDDKIIIVGSFNWLSASRDNCNFNREKTSLIYQGENVSQIIETILEPIKKKVKNLLPS